ncbi:hypothetical protein R50076_34270 [Gilvimarinus japonicus]
MHCGCARLKDSDRRHGSKVARHDADNTYNNEFGVDFDESYNLLQNRALGRIATALQQCPAAVGAAEFRTVSQLSYRTAYAGRGELGG